MPTANLQSYISEMRTKGVADEQIKAELLKHGWPEKDVNAAITPIQSSSPVPPPPDVSHFGMWIGFLYIILFIALYVTATAFGGILHYAVDELIPDKLDTVNLGYGAGQYLMQGYLACLIVGFPIFAVLFLFLKGQTLKNPAIKNLRIRKILIYLTLIGTFLIMLGHIIITVYGLLGGSVTMRAIGHLGVTLFVAGGIFIYFLQDVLGDRKQS